MFEYPVVIHCLDDYRRMAVYWFQDLTSGGCNHGEGLQSHFAKNKTSQSDTSKMSVAFSC